MIRAVRHFLWYLEHRSTGGRTAPGPSRPASLHLGSPSNEASARARQAAKRSPGARRDSVEINAVERRHN
jgi:hypothetical protein